jgi:ubiquinone/menaquinone biosynthesis C-methylase UbiE
MRREHQDTARPLNQDVYRPMEGSRMAGLDPYHVTDQLDDAFLDVIIARLEARGKHPFFHKVLAEYLDAMDVDAASTVLDMGSGTGVAARSIARRPNFSGKVTGVDLSPYLAQTAARLSAEEGLGERIDFRAGDTRSLDLADKSFDAVIAHTLISHVEDPLIVLKEIARVVRPGGMVAIFDGDYASMTFTLSDEEQTRQYDEAIINAIVTSPRAMRYMPRLMRDAGLQMVRVFPYVMADVGKVDFWLSGIESFEKLAPKSGALTEDEAKRWFTSLVRDSEEGIFFGACNYYGYVARRPEQV